MLLKSDKNNESVLRETLKKYKRNYEDYTFKYRFIN